MGEVRVTSAPTFIVAGLDPGVDGALALLAQRNDGSIEDELFDLPTVTIEGHALVKRRIDGRGLARILRARIPAGVRVFAFVEQVGTIGSQGKEGDRTQIAVSLGRSMGAIEGVFEALGIVPSTVHSQTWKSHYGLGSNKGAARAIASSLYPAAELHLVKHHNRAEALLIANYALRKLVR